MTTKTFKAELEETTTAELVRGLEAFASVARSERQKLFFEAVARRLETLEERSEELASVHRSNPNA